MLHGDGATASGIAVRVADATTDLYLAHAVTDERGRFEFVGAADMRFAVSCEVPATAVAAALSARLGSVALGDSIELVLRAGP